MMRLRLPWCIVAAVLAACASSPRGGAASRAQPVDSLLIVRSDSPMRIVPLDSARVDSLRKAGVVLERAVDERPAIIMMDRLEYPEDLRQARIEGRVVLRCIVSRDGFAEPNTIVVVSAMDVAFIPAAKEALRRARFRPGKVAGQPVRTLVTVPFDFKIH